MIDFMIGHFALIEKDKDKFIPLRISRTPKIFSFIQKKRKMYVVPLTKFGYDKCLEYVREIDADCYQMNRVILNPTSVKIMLKGMVDEGKLAEILRRIQEK